MQSSFQTSTTQLIFSPITIFFLYNLYIWIYLLSGLGWNNSWNADISVSWVQYLILIKYFIVETFNIIFYTNMNIFEYDG